MAGSLGLGVAGIANPQRQATKVNTIPGPNLGINVTGALYGMQPAECLYNYNLIPSEYGARTRKGFAEQSNGMTGLGVHQIVPYAGGDPTGDRLFAATNAALYDCTTPGAAVQKLAFTDVSSNAGYGTFTHYINDAGNDTLLACFELNGLFEYDPVLDTWAQATGVIFPDATTEADIDFIVSHKQRLWLVPRNASHAYYLSPGAKAGTAIRFDFGNKFKQGGFLVGLYTWTIDGGDGVDDYFLAVGSQGDVIMYRGDDPANPSTWATTGTWFIGEIPAGRNGVSEVGGDVWILSTAGIISARSLVKGVASPALEDSPSYKIARIIRERMTLEKDERGWGVYLNANEGQFVINSPERTSTPDVQYVYSITMNAWGIWRGVPSKCFGYWNGRLFFGGNDTRVWEVKDSSDYVYLNPADGDPSQVEFSVLSSYQDYGESGLFKRVQYLRPTFISSVTPDFDVKALYNYDVIEPIFSAAPSAEGPGEWDSGLWDLAVWGGALSSYEVLQGGEGLGRVFAYALRGSASERATLASTDFMWDTGGML